MHRFMRKKQGKEHNSRVDVADYCIHLNVKGILKNMDCGTSSKLGLFNSVVFIISWMET